MFTEGALEREYSKTSFAHVKLLRRFIWDVLEAIVIESGEVPQMDLALREK